VGVLCSRPSPMPRGKGLKDVRSRATGGILKSLPAEPVAGDALDPPLWQVT